jgi:hypothetical protein
MPSPDVSQYVDLTLFDLNSQDIYLKALDYARIALPEWQPVEGSIENVLLQAMALEVQEVATSINRLPSGIVQALLGILGVPRLEGLASTGVVRINAAVQSDVYVASGLRLYYQESISATPVTIITTQSVTLTRSRSLQSLARSSNTATAVTIDRHGFSDADVDAGLVLVITSDEAAAASFVGTVTLASIVDDYTFTFASTGDNAGTISLVNSTSAATVPDSVEPYGFAEVSSVIAGYNFVPTNTPLTLLTAVREISYIELITDLDGGKTAETDADYFQRASAALSRMTSALVTVDQIAQYVASEFSNVYRVKAIDNCNVTREPDALGETLIVCAPIGATEENGLTTGQLTTITEAVSARTHAALVVNTDNAFVGRVKIEAEIHPVENVTDAIAEAACTEALNAYLNPNSWPWDNTVRVNEVMHVIRNATHNGSPVVAYVTNVQIEITGANVPLLENPYGYGTFSTASRTSDVLTVPATGSNLTADDYVAVTLDDWATSYIYQVLSAPNANTFTVAQAGDNASNLSGKWCPISTYDPETNDLIFYDPSPLVMSGAHIINTL